jgi:dihydrodipicolinate synthase/N-acetylneuraminate lyase
MRRAPVRWSVGIEAEGDRVFTREEIVELADAVAAHSGIATGIGTSSYGARLLVVAGSRDEAIEKAAALFKAAAQMAGLPAAPVVRAEAISEDEDEEAQASEADAVDASGLR